jgi:hypothetical protein
MMTHNATKKDAECYSASGSGSSRIVTGDATSRKGAGSTPNEVTGFFSVPNPCSSTMAPRSNQPLTDTSTTNVLEVTGRPATP